jgi:hypothetical protein
MVRKFGNAQVSLVCKRNAFLKNAFGYWVLTVIKWAYVFWFENGEPFFFSKTHNCILILGHQKNGNGNNASSFFGLLPKLNFFILLNVL